MNYVSTLIGLGVGGFFISFYPMFGDAFFWIGLAAISFGIMIHLLKDLKRSKKEKVRG